MEALFLSVSLNMKNKTQKNQQKLTAILFLLMGLGFFIFSQSISPKAKLLFDSNKDERDEYRYKSILIQVY